MLPKLLNFTVSLQWYVCCSGLTIGHVINPSPVHESVLQQRRHGVDVVFAHLSDVFEQEGEGLEHAVLHIQLGHAVFIHERGQHGERRAGLCHDGDGHGGADSVLALLDLQVVEQSGQDVVGADRREREVQMMFVETELNTTSVEPPCENNTPI